MSFIAQTQLKNYLNLIINMKEETLDKNLEEQLQESNEKYLRLYAEYDNYRKRVHKEKEDLVFATKSTMLSTILDMDNDVAIALHAIKDDSSKEGVLLIAQKLKSFLKSQNVEEIQTDSYDDNLHEVISVISGPKNKIVEVVSKGYKIGDKVLRFPKVVLSK